MQVQPEHDGYHGSMAARFLNRFGFPRCLLIGYAAGDVIGDHDHALCYVMDSGLFVFHAPE